MDQNNIKEAFKNSYETDKIASKIPPWMARWEVSEEMHSFKGPDDFSRWFEWAAFPKPHYFSQEEITPLVEKSQSYHQKLIDQLSLNIDVKDYEVNSIYNAQDYLLQNLYPTPKRMDINRILDFGAGYGRQANLWTQLRKDIVYVGMDAIELPYCLQHLYYKSMDLPLHDYIFEKEKFEIKNKPGIYHLPTWRHDLLPNNFFNLIICVQVLHELNPKTLKEMIKVFQRILKPGGMLYIRDHELSYTPGNRINLKEYLPKNGFALEFKPHIIDKEDLHGIPQIWRKIDQRVEKSQKQEKISLKSIMNRVINLSPRIGNKIKKFYRRLKTD